MLDSSSNAIRGGASDQWNVVAIAFRRIGRFDPDRGSGVFRRLC
jgi:hypothetical protein